MMQRPGHRPVSTTWTPTSRHACPRVGHEIVDLVEARDAYRRRASELGLVHGQDHLARLRDDRLRYAHLVDVEIEQRAVRVERRRADQRIIDLEATDEIHGERADDGAIAGTHPATRRDHFDRCARRQNIDDVQIVGDDQQVAVTGQVRGDRLGRRTDIDEQTSTVRDERRGRRADRGLGTARDRTACRMVEIVDAGRDDCSAMDA